ncbi:tyrosine-type recombinase/integrase [Arenimonas alkanexedens]
MKSKITQSLAEKAPTPQKGKTDLHADTELRGFYLIVSPTKRSYYVQSLVNGKQVRAKIGDHPAISAKDARDLARKTLVSMRSGANPNEERRKARAKGITVRQALELHLAAKTLSPKTVEGYRYNCGQYLADWMDRPLVELGTDRAAVRERHAKITRQNGATTADSTFRVFRAIYNRGLREHPDLPANPAANVDYHGQKRRKVEAAPDKLKRWGRAVLALDNPVRRDLHLFFILTGMRRTAACEARLDDVDGFDGTLHVPNPKGGTSRAFDLALSKPLCDLVATRMEESLLAHRTSPWLFPSSGKTGRVAEVQQSELEGLTGHALRHVYATLALESGVPVAELKFLLNHAADSVTMGYLAPSVEHLRVHQTRASAYILKRLGLDHTPGQWPPRLAEDEPSTLSQ